MTMYPNRTGLMIGIPLSGNPLVPEWAFAFHSLHPPMDYNVEYAMVKGRKVDDARNQIAQTAVDKNIKYLFFIDEDVTPPAHAVRQLIYHMEHFPKVAVAGGIYCHKSPPNMPMVFRGNGAGPYWDWKVGEVFDIGGIGMGCTLIRVDALKTIEKPWFKTVDSVEAYMNGIQMGELWTEDLYFCDKITKAGFQIIADGGLLADHWDAKTGTPYNLAPHAKPFRRPEVEMGKKKIVDLGSGAMKDSYHTEEGTVLRVDIREDVAPDYRCDLRVLPFGNKEFDIVFSSHTLEHFERKEIPAVLDEWIRILKDDGEFRLVLPNLEWAAQHIMNKEIDGDVMNVLYGAQSYEYNYHKTGFTPQIVEQLLAERGFKKFVWDFNNYHMFVRAWKVVPQELVDAGLLEAGHAQPIIRVKAEPSAADLDAVAAEHKAAEDTNVCALCPNSPVVMMEVQVCSHHAGEDFREARVGAAKIYPWTCMRCRKSMAIPAGSAEPMCSCKEPIKPREDQINAGPWVEALQAGGLR